MAIIPTTMHKNISKITISGVADPNEILGTGKPVVWFSKTITKKVKWVEHLQPFDASLLEDQKPKLKNMSKWLLLVCKLVKLAFPIIPLLYR